MEEIGFWKKKKLMVSFKQLDTREKQIYRFIVINLQTMNLQRF